MPGRPEVLEGQPAITEILGLGRAAGRGELDKKTLLTALLAFKKGDFSARLPIDLDGIDGKIADAFNEVIELQRAHEPRSWSASAAWSARKARSPSAPASAR